MTLTFSVRVAGNVSAVFTYKWKGEDMARLLDDSTRRVMVKITIASHCTRPYGNINRYVFALKTKRKKENRSAAFALNRYEIIWKRV